MGANACHNAEDARDALQVDSLDVMTTSEHKGNEGAMLSDKENQANQKENSQAELVDQMMNDQLFQRPAN
jgi:hypothetical protein